MVALFEENGFVLSVEEDVLYNFVISISTGEKKFEAIVEWSKENTK
jgi:prophage maintenance system killer protein